MHRFQKVYKDEPSNSEAQSEVKTAESGSQTVVVESISAETQTETIVNAEA